MFLRNSFTLWSEDVEGARNDVCAAAGLEKQLDLLVVGHYQGPLLLWFLMRSLSRQCHRPRQLGRKPRQSRMGVFVALLAAVVVVPLVCGVGTPISGSAVAQNRGSALPSSSLHEH